MSRPVAVAAQHAQSLTLWGGFLTTAWNGRWEATWRAVRAGFIVRAQRAIPDGDRPFKRDVSRPGSDAMYGRLYFSFVRSYLKNCSLSAAHMLAALWMGALAFGVVLGALALFSKQDIPWATSAFRALSDKRIATLLGAFLVAAHIGMSRYYARRDELTENASAKGAPTWPGTAYTAAVVLFVCYASKSVG